MNKKPRRRRVVEGTILQREDGTQYMAAQIEPGGFKFISRDGNRWTDKKVCKGEELDQFAKDEGFKVIRQGGF